MPAKLAFTILTLSIALASALACQTGALKTPVAEAGATPSHTPLNRDDVITIAAVGDIMLGSTAINDSFLPPNDGRDLLKEVTPILSAADIAFGNLEGPMLEGGKSPKCAAAPPNPNATPTPTPSPTPSTSGTPAKKPNVCFAFRVPTRYGQWLKDAGFDVLSLANNHASDYGDYGRTSTRNVLDKLGMKYAGSDRAKFSTAYLEVKGVKLAVVGFAHNAIVPNVNDIDAAKALVAAAKKKADIVIVSFHGGAEGEAAQHVPNQTEIFVGEKRGNLPLFAHSVIDAGADLVLGHGPHVLRGMEMYRGHLIAYSMGNFATYGMFGLKGATPISAIFEIALNKDGTFAGAQIHPVKQLGRGGPLLDESGAAIVKLKELSTADFGANAPKINDDGSVSGK